MADDAGALLVRSGLVSSSALDAARARVEADGGTLGEQLVVGGAVTDDVLTDFYKQRLLVPQVNPNTLARLPAKVVAVIPSDMAIELRAIPVSLDADNNLTVAMSDPSDRHAVDEIAFFTGTYVVRAVATQMQIAWCLAHYYGHVTHLGKRLLQPSSTGAPPRAIQAAVRPRPRGFTGKVDAMRRKAIAPGAPVDGDAGARPTSEPATPRVVTETAVVPDPDAPEPRARSISGEIRVPIRRAPSIKPPIPDEDDDAPIVSMEVSPEASEPQVMTIEADEPTDEPADAPTDRSRPAPPRRKRPAEPDPPELAARAGEVSLKTGRMQRVELEEPRIIIADELETPPSRRVKTGELKEVSGEVVIPDPPGSRVSVEVPDDASVPVMIHDRARDRSEPVLLERLRSRGESDAPTHVTIPAAPDDGEEDDEVVVLQARKQAALRGNRPERRTQVGIGANAAATRPKDAEDAVPLELEDAPTGSRSPIDVDPTRVDTPAAPPDDDISSDESLAAPPSPMGDDDTSPVAMPPSGKAAPPPSGQVRMSRVMRAPSVHDDDEDAEQDQVLHGKATTVMSAIELDDVIPQRAAEVVPGHLGKPKPIDHDAVDDGWGPPGTTIPPPLLGAIPGSVTPGSGIIPIPNLDSAPLMVAPPVPPEKPRSSTESLARTLEETTSRVLVLIGALGQTTDRDEVVALMTAHLAESHRRAGFFATRGGELSLFSLIPRPSTMPFQTLRLDRPSTLQDVVGTRLPYRGPMHDDASRTFLAATLGSCPAEILLVPITVRERVVGVLFGEHRLRHTFDDQVALAGRAAGMALERILKARRG